MVKEVDWPFATRSYFLWVLIPMLLIFLFANIFDTVFLEDPESGAKAEWCKEYYPNKSWNECVKIAGW